MCVCFGRMSIMMHQLTVIVFVIRFLIVCLVMCLIVTVTVLCFFALRVVLSWCCKVDCFVLSSLFFQQQQQDQ